MSSRIFHGGIAFAMSFLSSVAMDVFPEKLEKFRTSKSMSASDDRKVVDWNGDETGIDLLQKGPNYPHLAVNFKASAKLDTNAFLRILDLNPATLNLSADADSVASDIDIQAIIDHPNFSQLESCTFECFQDIRPFMNRQFLPKIKGVVRGWLNGVTSSALDAMYPEQLAESSMIEFGMGPNFGAGSDIFRKRAAKIQLGQRTLTFLGVPISNSEEFTEETVGRLISGSTQLLTYNLIATQRAILTEGAAGQLRDYIASLEKLTEFEFIGFYSEAGDLYPRAVTQGLVLQSERFSSLKTLSVSVMVLMPELWDEFHKFAKRQNGLISLEIDCCNMEGKAKEIMTTFAKNNPQLESLTLGEMPSDDLGDVLNELSGNRLETIRFRNPPSVWVLLRLLQSQPNLNSISMDGSDVTYSADEALSLVAQGNATRKNLVFLGNAKLANISELVKGIVMGLKQDSAQSFLSTGGRVELNFYGMRDQLNYTIFNNAINAVVSVKFLLSQSTKTIDAATVNMGDLDDIISPPVSVVPKSSGLFGLGYFGL